MTNWSNNYVRQNEEKKLRKYIRELESEYERLMNTYEPTGKKLKKPGLSSWLALFSLKH